MSSAACRGNGRDARARVSSSPEDNDFLRCEIDVCDCCGAAFEERADVGQGRKSARPAPRSRSCWVELPLLALTGQASVPCLRASSSRRLASTNQRGSCVPRPEPRLTKAVRRTELGRDTLRSTASMNNSRVQISPSTHASLREFELVCCKMDWRGIDANAACAGNIPMPASTSDSGHDDQATRLGHGGRTTSPSRQRTPACTKGAIWAVAGRRTMASDWASVSSRSGTLP